MDINSIKTQLEELSKLDNIECAMKGTNLIDEITENIKSNNLNISTILSICDILLQTTVSNYGNLFQLISFLPFCGSRFIVFLETLLEKELSLAVYNILVYQGNLNQAKPAGYNLAHGRHKESFYEKIIDKLPEDMNRNLDKTAFVVYLDEERTEAVEYDLLGDGVRYLL